MAASMERTRYPGIFKRGGRYVVVYRAHGVQRKESARTLEEARRMKRARETDHDRGEFQAESRMSFKAYATEWVGRYQGTGRRGFRENTRADYRRDLERYAFPFFDERLGRTVSAITPRDVANWLAWLCEQPAPAGRKLSDQSVRRIFAPLRSCLATAKREGIIRHNPCAEAALPHRPAADSADVEEVRAFTRDQLAAFLAVVHPRYGLAFELLATTGLRWSEFAALRWADLELDGEHPALAVRRAWVRGAYGPPKSRHGRRDVPLTWALADKLRAARKASEWPRDGDLVFASLRGTPLDHADVMRRVLRPAAAEAGAPWAGFHTFRHTCATLMFARGANAVQVQRRLGHHSPSFTLDTYVHLLPDDPGDPVDLAVELAQGGNTVATHGRGPTLTIPDSPAREPVGLRELSD